MGYRRANVARMVQSPTCARRLQRMLL